MADLLSFVWGLFVGVVGGLPAAQQEDLGRWETLVPITVVARVGVHGAQHATSLSLAGEFDFRTGNPTTGHPSPSLRAQGRAAALQLLQTALPAAGLVDADLAAALEVSETVARGLRCGHRCFAVGDLIVLRRRLPDLFALLRGALLDRSEGP